MYFNFFAYIEWMIDVRKLLNQWQSQWYFTECFLRYRDITMSQHFPGGFSARLSVNVTDDKHTSSLALHEAPFTVEPVKPSVLRKYWLQNYSHFALENIAKMRPCTQVAG